MSKPEISIVLPGIRQQNWDAVYDSIVASTKKTFELIICGPFPLTPQLEVINCVKYVKDYGSPVRASQIAASMCEGELVTWIADDGILLPDSLDKNIDLLRSMGDNNKNVVVTKYYEGKNGTEKPLQPDNYFKLNGSDWTSSPFISKEWWLFNVAIIHRTFFEELGGWDSLYEGTFYSHADMAVRAQYLGANVKMSDFPLLNCDHEQLDHAPIESAQIIHDKPLFQSRYRNPSWTMGEMRLDINNWKDSSAVWKRRFG